MKNRSIGVVLLNMGGPNSLDDVAPFLYNLFSDRDIIQLGPKLLQKPLAWLISRRRAPKSKDIYSKIGGSSPLKHITQQQAAELERALEGDGTFIVKVAMRYWPPSATEAIQELISTGVEKIIALPLYPHYCRATSGSSLDDLSRAHQMICPELPLQKITSWPDEAHYITALAEKISQGSALFNNEPFQLVYSAHSLPVSFIKEGDPYVDELKKTITALEEKTGITGRLCYQSRSGPVEWMSPATSEMLQALADEGCHNVLMMPISFVSDHVETLYEINMLFREQAHALHMRLESTTALNSDPQFIAGLRALVLKADGL